MDQPDDAQGIFEAIVADLEVRKAAREFDNLDHSGGQNIPDANQVAAASAVMAKARELRRILGR
tara:strand:- start:454 stop:645 length:192 start_codon:yes stop_codon:yes gene_type:complete